MNLFDAITASGALEPIDLHLGRLFQRHADDSNADAIAVAAALLSRERSRGHSCIDLGHWAGRSFPADGTSPLPSLPEFGAWQKAVAASAWVSDGSQPTPLVDDGAGRLYLSRYWHAEQRLARHLTERLGSAPTDVDTARLAPLFQALFEPREGTASEGTGIDWQAVAAAAALAGSVVLVSGGPGTGKTTTVARILALLVAADPTTRIALAAPTGKAAARLGEAISEQLATLPVDDALRAQVPHSASTLHRLLGYEPRRDRFRHDARRPLPCDTLVIDEASMVDLLMMDAALDALPPSSRIILLGDKDQLASVETGFVFGDLCAASPAGGSYSPHFTELFRRLSCCRLDDLEANPAAEATENLAAEDRAAENLAAENRLEDATVELRVSYRFRDQPGIGELSVAIRGVDANGALAVLDDAGYADVGRLDPPETQHEALLPLLAAIDAYFAADSAALALERLCQFRILCARRRGDWGIERMNAIVERHLSQQGHAIGERWYPGRPILVTANDYQVRLFNGDLGVCWLEEGRLWAFFPGTDATHPRRLPLAKLPPHDTAWAMTVHKSQGSEFNQVLLVLGDTDSPVIGRELLYTGITRARQQVVVVGTAEIISAAIRRGSHRSSGLVDALRTADASTTPGPLETTDSAEPADETGEAGEPQQLSLFG